jgi:protein SCO1
MTGRTALWAASGLALALAGMAALVLRPADKFDDCRQSVIAGGAGAIGGPFTLVDENGQTVTDTQVITQPSLIYFGYSFCPDVCPLDNARNAEAVDLLAEQGVAVTPVFITIDPARDTAPVLKEYTDYIHAGMIGLTGSPEQVKAAADAYRVIYRPDGDGEDYLMSHTTMTYLVLPSDGYVEFYRRDETAEAVANSAACYIRAM